MSKNIVTGFAVAAVALGVIGAGTIYAQSGDMAGKNIVERIAQRFNLNQADVQEVFNEQRDERKVIRQGNLEDKLNTFVAEGKITEDQKNALLQKMEEMQNINDDYENLSMEERRAKMDERKSDFDSWLRENNIDIEDFDLNFGFGKGGPRMQKEGGRMIRGE